MNEPKPQLPVLATNLNLNMDGSYVFRLYADRGVLRQLMTEERESFLVYTLFGQPSYVLIEINRRYDPAEVVGWVVSRAEELHKEFELDRALDAALGG